MYPQNFGICFHLSLIDALHFDTVMTCSNTRVFRKNVLTGINLKFSGNIYKVLVENQYFFDFQWNIIKKITRTNIDQKLDQVKAIYRNFCNLQL